MWSPTHAVVIVRRAENLLIKGKNGTNNAFVLIKLGDDVYKTSTLENSGKSVTWNEECELKIPDSGNTASVVLKVMHKNHLGANQLIGIAKIPLSSFDKDERCTEWLKLEGKQKTNDKFRGILEVEIGFVAREEKSQLLSSSQTKEKFSVEKLTGSLFGLNQGEKKLKLKTIATSLQKTVLRKKRKSDLSDSLKNSNEEIHKKVNDITSPAENNTNLDPGVISDDEEDPSKAYNDTLNLSVDNSAAGNGSVPSNASVHLPSPVSTPPQIAISHCRDINDDNPCSSLIEVNSEVAPLSNAKEEKTYSSLLHLEGDLAEPPTRLSKLARKFKSFQSIDKKDLKRTVIGCETGEKYDENLASLKSDFKNKNKDELIHMIVDLQKRVNCVTLRVKDLEDYLDTVLLKVMENLPKIIILLKL